MIFQGIRTSIAKESYNFVTFQGGLDPLSLSESAFDFNILNRRETIMRLAPFLKQLFINVSCHILEASLTLMALFYINLSCHILVASLSIMALFKTEPSELDWLQVYDIVSYTCSQSIYDGSV